MPQIEEVCDIGSQRELFVDRYLIDRLDGTSLNLHHPQPAGVAIHYDQPWEDRLAFYTTVLKDDDIYRMYYRGSLMGGRPHPTCYAESRDGIHWTKPDLGLVEINGSTKNNAILRYITVSSARLLTHDQVFPKRSDIKRTHGISNNPAV